MPDNDQTETQTVDTLLVDMIKMSAAATMGLGAYAAKNDLHMAAFSIGTESGKHPLFMIVTTPDNDEIKALEAVHAQIARRINTLKTAAAAKAN